MSLLPDEAPRFDSCVNISAVDIDYRCTEELSSPDTAAQLDIEDNINVLMCKAYGESLLSSARPTSFQYCITLPLWEKHARACVHTHTQT